MTRRVRRARIRRRAAVGRAGSRRRPRPRRTRSAGACSSTSGWRPHDVDASRRARRTGCGTRDCSTTDEADALVEALAEVGREIADGTFAFDDADEDVHSAIERGVTDRSGDVGARLHAGRSRNDLVVTDLRLWVLAAGRRIEGLTTMLVAHARRAGARARARRSCPAPPTRVRRSPSRSATICWRTPGRCCATSSGCDQWADRTSTSALGSRRARHVDARARSRRRRPRGSGSGARSTTRSTPCPTATSCQEFLADATICATHLSRLAADLARWTDPALGWAELDEAYTTGSSMMPQKRNPDTAELARAKAARIVGGVRRGERPSCRGCRSGTTAISRRTRSRCSTPPTRSSSCSPRSSAPSTRSASTPAAMRASAARRGALRDRSRRGAGARRRAVPRGAPADGRAAEAARPGRSGSSRPHPGGMGSRSASPMAPSLLDPEVSVRARTTPGGPSPASVRQRADAVSAALAARVP